MAEYKFERFLRYTGDGLYDKPVAAGTVAPKSGIYRCDGCGHEVTILAAATLPGAEHHPHTSSQKLVRWKLIVADGGPPAPATNTHGSGGSTIPNGGGSPR